MGAAGPPARRWRADRRLPGAMPRRTPAGVGTRTCGGRRTRIRDGRPGGVPCARDVVQRAARGPVGPAGRGRHGRDDAARGQDRVRRGRRARRGRGRARRPADREERLRRAARHSPRPRRPDRGRDGRVRLLDARAARRPRAARRRLPGGAQARRAAGPDAGASVGPVRARPHARDPRGGALLRRRHRHEGRHAGRGRRFLRPDLARRGRLLAPGARPSGHVAALRRDGAGRALRRGSDAARARRRGLLGGAARRRARQARPADQHPPDPRADGHRGRHARQPYAALPAPGRARRPRPADRAL